MFSCENCEIFKSIFFLQNTSGGCFCFSKWQEQLFTYILQKSCSTNFPKFGEIHCGKSQLSPRLEHTTDVFLGIFRCFGQALSQELTRVVVSVIKEGIKLKYFLGHVYFKVRLQSIFCCKLKCWMRSLFIIFTQSNIFLERKLSPYLTYITVNLFTFCPVVYS